MLSGMMFGRRKPVARNPYDTPGIGEGMSGPAGASPLALDPPVAAPVSGFGRFMADDNIGGVLANFATALSASTGGVGAQIMEQQARERSLRMQGEREQSQYQQRRADDRDEWTRRQIWERDNPAPRAQNDTVDDYEFIKERLGQDAADQHLRAMGDPMVTLQLPGNRVYNGPRSGLAAAMGTGGQAAAPAAPNAGPAPGSVVNGMRFKGGDYRSPQSWEPEGGAASQGAGTFP